MDESQHGRWPEDLVESVRHSGKLCLNIDNPGWDDARGYLLRDEPMALYFPVSKKYLPDDLNHCRVLIWSQPQVLLTGELQPARSEEDTALQIALAQRSGLSTEDAEYMVLDQRTKRARRSRFKLLVHHMEAIPH